MKITLTIFAFLCSVILCAQSKLTPAEFNLTGGQSYTSFLFRDSEGNNDQKFNYANGYSFGLNMAFRVRSKHFLRPELLVHQGGATTVFGGNELKWKLNYASFNLGYLFRFVNEENRFRFSIQSGIAFGLNYFFQGTQNINDLSYNLRETEAFKPIDINGSFILQGKYNITQSFHAGIEYRFNQGFIQIENSDAEFGQKTRNIGHFALINLGFKIK
jgi:hypothetical protein